ncbi:hypothetical protein [Streptomyces sp. NPDC046942]|uniref:hypothetical protein n=1 Tax=Streptomyces sp. NPDC046942 TaxID=3155137 RepID=UPI00340B1FB4
MLGLERDTTQDSTGVDTQRYAATSGGAACTEFLNASNASAGVYGSSAAVVKGFTAHGKVGPLGITVTLVSHTSVAAAQRVIDDTRRSAKGCAHLTFDDGGTLGMNLAPMSLPVVGDDSTVTRVGVISGKQGLCVTVGLVRVGAVSLNITVKAADGYYFNDLRAVAKASVIKLRERNPGS